MAGMIRPKLPPCGTIALLLGLPLLVRLIAWLELRADPFFRLLVVDARSYHEMAASMAAGTWRMEGPFWQPPFYPFLLSLVYRVFGPAPDAARLLQIGCGALVSLLVFRIGGRLLGPRAAWAAWGVAALHGALVFFDLQLLNASLATLLLTLGVERLLAWEAARRRRDLLLAGGALGLASITVATLLALIPAGLLWVAWRTGAGRPQTPGQRLRPALLVLAAAALPVLSVTVINLAASGQPVLVSYNGGVNFWIGNNADYERTVLIRPGRAWQALMQEPVDAGARSESETSAWFFRRAAAWIAADPGAWAGLMAKKTHRVLRGDEQARNQEIYPFRERSRLLSVLLWSRGVAFPSGILLPLGWIAVAAVVQAGIFRRRAAWGAARGADRAIGPPTTSWFRQETRWSGLVLLAALVIVHGLAVALFFPASRYRLPVGPLLAVLAVAGAVHLAGAIRAFREGCRGAAVLPLVALVIGGLVANAGLPPMPLRFHSDTYSDLGTLHFQQQKLDDAARWYEEALELDPENAEAAHNLAAIWIHRGKPESAEPLLRRVLARYPSDPNALTNLGNCYLLRGEPYRAGRYFAQVIAANPGSADAARGLDRARELAGGLERERMAGDPEAFLRGLERMLAQEPANGFLRERIARLRAGGAAE